MTSRRPANGRADRGEIPLSKQPARTGPDVASRSAETADWRWETDRRRIYAILGSLMLAMLLAALDQTIVATALPTIAADLGGLNHLSWVVTAYLITSTISTPLWGKLGDLYGRKRLFQAAIVIFLVGSALSGVSQTMGELIAFRALQGIGAGGLIVGAISIVGDVVSPRERGRYQGMFGAVFGLASIAGPLLGGYFTEHLSWRWVFYINLPIGIVALAVVGLVLRTPSRRTEHSIDYLGTVLLAGAVTSLILMTTWGGTTYAWGSGTIIGLGVAAAVLLVAFVLVERSAAEPVLPLSLFRSRVFSMSSAAGFIVGFSMFGAIIYLPTFLQTVFGSSPTKSGLQLLPMMAGLLLASVGSGQIITRWGRYKLFPILGTGIMVIGLFLFAQMTPTTSLFVASLYMFVLGLGLGLVMQVLVLIVQNSVPYRDLGAATSASTFFRSIGGSFGVAIFGAIFDSQLHRNLAKFLPPQAAARLGTGNVTTTPAQLKTLPPAIHQGFVQAFSHSLHIVFLTGVPVAVVAFLITWFIPELPLRQQGAPPGQAPASSAVAPVDSPPADAGPMAQTEDPAPSGPGAEEPPTVQVAEARLPQPPSS